MVHFPLFLACLPACSRSADRCRQGRQGEAACLPRLRRRQG